MDMNCPACGSSEHGRVLETRTLGNGVVLRRRRACSCGHRWTTYEVNDDAIRSVEKLVEHAIRSAVAAKRHATHSAIPPTGSVPTPLPVVVGGVGGGLPSALSVAPSSSDPSRRSGSGRSAPARDTIYPVEFEQAWESTARTGSKFKALGAWKKHGKPAAEVIARSWARWSQLDQWQRGIVPHVSTWLNGRCFEQEPAEVVARAVVPEKVQHSRNAWREVLDERKAAR